MSGTENPATGTPYPLSSGDGTIDPATGTLNPSLDVWYLDWSLRNGVTAVRNDSEGVEHFKKGTNEFLDALASPSKIIMESTVHSFVPEWREAFIKRCEDEGHTLLFVPPRETGRWSRELGIDKSDFNDPLVIRAIVKAGAHLKRPSTPEPEYVAKRAAANRKLMLLRASGEKDEYAKALIEGLPDYASLSNEKKLALGNGKRYSFIVVAAAGVATEVATSRKEFERLCGLYAHGYPSQIRADLYHWQWSGGAKRARLNGEPISEDKDGKKTYGLRKRDDLTLSEFRRSLRWLYAAIKAGTADPATGTRDPADTVGTKDPATGTN